MKKLLIVFALCFTAAATVYAIDGEKKESRKARKSKKEMKCCTKEEQTECKKEAKMCCSMKKDN